MASSLEKSRTPAILHAEILVKSSGFCGVFLAVEGDFDSKFWGSRIDVNQARIVNCGGKPNLLGLLDLYEQHNYQRLAAVVDADFDRLLGSLRALWCLSYTDKCDLESTLVHSDALDRILAEYGDAQKIQHFESIKGHSVREHIRTISTCFGKLRFINAAQGYGVDFDKLSTYKYIDKASWAFDEAKLIQEFLALAKITDEQLAVDKKTLLSQLACDEWGLVQGHDCMNILAIGLNSDVIGQTRQKSINQTELQKAFRLAFDPALLTSTKMYQDLIKVQKLHNLPLFS